MKNIAFILICFFLLSSCGAKTKHDLIAEAKLHDEYEVNDNYQSIYKRTVDKLNECTEGLSQYIQRDLYTELGEGEMFFPGAGGDGYAFLVQIKKTGDNQSSVKTYSKITSGYYPKFMAIARMGAYNQSGCP